MEPRIAATTDNRFVMAWQRYENTNNGWVDDIYYTIRDASGQTIKPVTRFTWDTPGWDEGYYYPNLTKLRDNRVLFVWWRYSDKKIYYSVLDSAGNTIKQQTSIEAQGWYPYPDAVQLSDGKTVIAWSGSVGFVVLDSNYNVVAGPTILSNPAAVTGDDYVSVAADADGHAIITWTDSDWYYRFNLYYASVDSSGSVLTPPMIFRTSRLIGSRIETNYEGYGNTSYNLLTPTSDSVDGRITSPLAGGPPGGIATILASVGNYGRGIATSVVCTATLDSNLTYVSANPTPISTTGGVIVWNLPNLKFLGTGQILLRVQVPSALIGTRYPVTWTLTSAGPEANPADNFSVTQVMVAQQVFLPVVLKDY